MLNNRKLNDPLLAGAKNKGPRKSLAETRIFGADDRAFTV
jgi:hypothetical protein